MIQNLNQKIEIVTNIALIVLLVFAGMALITQKQACDVAKNEIINAEQERINICETAAHLGNLNLQNLTAEQKVAVEVLRKARE